MRGVRGLSLRAAVALAIGAVGLAATLAVGVLAGHDIDRRLRREIRADLGELADHMADRLDMGMYARWREIQVAAGMAGLADASGPAARREALSRVSAAIPGYAAFVLIDPSGRVAAATVPGLEGEDVSRRDYFRKGSHGPYAGDVHDAMLLAGHGRGGEPPRFIDLAAPVPGSGGWVLAAHLDWAWAEGIRRSLARVTHARHPGADVMILTADGTVILGPQALVRSRVTPPPSRKGDGVMAATFPDGGAFLVGIRDTRGFDGYPGLGWRVVVREDAKASMAPLWQSWTRIAWWGLAVALATGVAAWFAARRVTEPLDRLAAAADALGRGEAPGVPTKGPGELVRVYEALARAGTEIRERERRQGLLVNELNHRVKNVLATVQSLAGLSARSAGGDVASFRRGLDARLMALARTHDLLAASAGEGVALRDILMAELAPYAACGRATLAGGDIALAPRTATALGMAVHELTANASRYGALSTPSGEVAVEWDLRGTEAGARLHVRWTESGGPAVVAPTRKGFGSRLILGGLAADLGGEATLSFEARGVACTIQVAVGSQAPVRSAA